MPQNNDFFQPLINAIDRQDIAPVKAFIKTNPNADYNNVNGMSLIWWALLTALGKGASLELLKVLLAARKENRDPLIKPTETYMSMTPREYIDYEFTWRQKEKIMPYLRTAEIIEIKNQKVNEASSSKLSEIANYRQNAHNPLIDRTCDENTFRLYKEYKAVLTDLAFDKFINQIKNFLENKRLLSESLFTKYQLKMISKSLTRVIQLPSIREIEDGCKLSIAQLLALVWAAAKETNPQLLPELNQNQNIESSIFGRKVAVLQSLLEAQTAYGDNHPACVGGTRNQIAMGLAAFHKLVNSGIEGVKFTGELAQHKINAYFGMELSKQFEKDPKTYWHIVRFNTLSDIEDVDESEYLNYIENNKERFHKDLEPFIEKETLNNYLNEALKYIYPLERHSISRDLQALLRILEKFKQPISDISNSDTPEQARYLAFKQVVTLMKDSPLYKLLLKKFDAKPSEELIGYLLENWLMGVAYNSKDDVPSLFQLWEDDNEESVINYSSNCFLFSIFQQQKNELIEKHPEQKKWLTGLTGSQVNTLLNILKENKGNIALNNLSEHFIYILQQALPLKITRELSLKNMEIEGLDLRGVDLRGANLQGAIFKNCIWRGAIFDETTNLTDTKFINCLMFQSKKKKNHFQSPFGKINQIEELAILARFGLSPEFESILKIKKLPSKVFIKPSNKYITPLHAAIESNSSTILQILNHKNFKMKYMFEDISQLFSSIKHSAIILGLNQDITLLEKILNHEKFKPNHFLEFTSIYKENIFLNAAQKPNPNMIKSIMDHDKFQQRFSLLQDKFGNNAIMNALLKAGSWENALAILNHPKFMLECITQKNKKGNNVFLALLESLVNEHDMTLADNLLNHPIFMRKGFNEKNNNGMNALMFSLQFHEIDMFNIILSHSYLEEKMLSQKNKFGNNVLMLAILDCNNEAVKGLLQHPFFTEKIFSEKNKNRSNVISMAARLEDNTILEMLMSSKHFSWKQLFEKEKNGRIPLDYLANKSLHNQALLQTLLTLDRYIHPHCIGIFNSITHHHKRFVKELLNDIKSGTLQVTMQTISNKISEYELSTKINPKGDFAKIKHHLPKAELNVQELRIRF